MKYRGYFEQENAKKKKKKQIGKLFANLLLKRLIKYKYITIIRYLINQYLFKTLAEFKK